MLEIAESHFRDPGGEESQDMIGWLILIDMWRWPIIHILHVWSIWFYEARAKLHWWSEFWTISLFFEYKQSLKSGLQHTWNMEHLSSQLLCCFVLASSMFFISKGEWPKVCVAVVNFYNRSYNCSWYQTLLL